MKQNVQYNTVMLMYSDIAVLSFCEIHQVAAVLYMCYAESMFLDPDVIKMYHKTLSTTPFKDIVKVCVFYYMYKLPVNDITNKCK